MTNYNNEQIKTITNTRILKLKRKDKKRVVFIIKQEDKEEGYELWYKCQSHEQYNNLFIDISQHNFYDITYKPLNKEITCILKTNLEEVMSGNKTILLKLKGSFISTEYNDNHKIASVKIRDHGTLSTIKLSYPCETIDIYNAFLNDITPNALYTFNYRSDSLEITHYEKNETLEKDDKEYPSSSSCIIS